MNGNLPLYFFFAGDSKRSMIVGCLFCAIGYPMLWFLINFLTTDILSPAGVSLLVPWILCVILLLLALLGEGAGLASFGIKPNSHLDPIWGIGMFFVGIILPFALFLFPTIAQDALQVVSSIRSMPIFSRIGIVITAGVAEEFIFRGYLFERVSALSGSITLAAIVCWVVFVVLHIPLWGLEGMWVIAVWGTIPLILYLIRRNLLLCMIIHCLNDGFWFILAPESLIEFCHRLIK